MDYSTPEMIEATVQAWQNGTLPFEIWRRHQTHLVVALWHVVTFSNEEAVERMRSGIQRFNAQHGVEMTPTSGYHETITLASLHLIRDYVIGCHDRTALPVLASGLLEVFPHTRTLLDFYTRDTLMSWEARIGWIPPDRAPLHFPLSSRRADPS